MNAKEMYVREVLANPAEFLNVTPENYVDLYVRLEAGYLIAHNFLSEYRALNPEHVSGGILPNSLYHDPVDRALRNDVTNIFRVQQKFNEKALKNKCKPDLKKDMLERMKFRSYLKSLTQNIINSLED